MHVCVCVCVHIRIWRQSIAGYSILLCDQAETQKPKETQVHEEIQNLNLLRTREVTWTLGATTSIGPRNHLALWAVSQDGNRTRTVQRDGKWSDLPQR